MPIGSMRGSIGGLMAGRAVSGMQMPGVANGGIASRMRVRTRSHVRRIATRRGIAARVRRIRLMHQTAADQSLSNVEVGGGGGVARELFALELSLHAAV